MASTKADPRTTIHCYFMKAHMTRFEAEAMRRYVNTLLDPFLALVGWSSMIADEDAMMLDVSSVAASTHYKDLCTDIFPVTSKLVLVRTGAADTVWEHSLTRTWSEDPTCIGEKLGHRPSRGDSLVFAQIAATPTQIAVAKARKGHAPLQASTSQPQTLQATIQIPLGTTGPIDQWLPRIMDLVGTAAGAALKKHSNEDGLRPGEWKPLSTWSGAVCNQCWCSLNLKGPYAPRIAKPVGEG